MYKQFLKCIPDQFASGMVLLTFGSENSNPEIGVLHIVK